jgi:hypothetical protein
MVWLNNRPTHNVPSLWGNHLLPLRQPQQQRQPRLQCLDRLVRLRVPCRTLLQPIDPMNRLLQDCHLAKGLGQKRFSLHTRLWGKLSTEVLKVCEARHLQMNFPMLPVR